MNIWEWNDEREYIQENIYNPIKAWLKNNRFWIKIENLNSSVFKL